MTSHTNHIMMVIVIAIMFAFTPAPVRAQEEPPVAPPCNSSYCGWRVMLPIIMK